MKVAEIVHYVSYGTPGGEYKSECRAAIITETYRQYPRKRGLAVLNPTGMFFNREVLHQPDQIGGTWHTIEECTG